MTNIILDRSEWLNNGSRGFENELTEILDLVDGYVVDATLPVNTEGVDYYPDSFCLQKIEDIKNLVHGIKSNSKVYAVDVVTVTTPDVGKVSLEDREALKVLSENVEKTIAKIKIKQSESLTNSLSASPLNSLLEQPSIEGSSSSELDNSELSSVEGSESLAEPPIVTIEDLETELSNLKIALKTKNEEVYKALPNVSIYQIRLTAV